MKLLVLGGNGQVGRELRRSLPALGEVVVATRDGAEADAVADFDAPESLADLVHRIAPDVVVNAAAHTAVDKAESEPDAAFRVNALGPAALAQGCAATGALLVHYSTDYVFDGSGSRPYREDDATSPLGAYGASKLAGEEMIRASGARHAILRTAWVYAAHGKNFLRTMLRLAGERDELRVVADQVGAPTPAAWIADATARIIAHGVPASGTWHLVAAGETSWHGFADAIMDEALAAGLLKRRPRVLPIATADYPTPARRPAYSVLDTAKLSADFGIVPPDWRDGLRAVLAACAAEKGV
ncbi:dTDP-4-dehydrorhamnose reductase [Thermomonas brevis]|uniref:dTDP-4-dehydrorhamnose reductase n=1 Tax=Thermomonas brevis TaxID=215691 RepID=A0A7G9QRZ4_9GAMM|nr:dTDP-4-dehydrorhamnose reductase [Thermomonas brevis]QNN46119.1 dTDP-4-dehydrorhamnose reductase [Thermomonas brevis]